MSMLDKLFPSRAQQQVTTTSGSAQQVLQNQVTQNAAQQMANSLNNSLAGSLGMSSGAGMSNQLMGDLTMHGLRGEIARISAQGSLGLGGTEPSAAQIVLGNDGTIVIAGRKLPCSIDELVGKLITAVIDDPEEKERAMRTHRVPGFDKEVEELRNSGVISYGKPVMTFTDGEHSWLVDANTGDLLDERFMIKGTPAELKTVMKAIAALEHE